MDINVDTGTSESAVRTKHPDASSIEVCSQPACFGAVTDFRAEVMAGSYA